LPRFLAVLLLQRSGPASCLQLPTSAGHTQQHWQHPRPDAQAAATTTSTAAAAPQTRVMLLLLLPLLRLLEPLAAQR
jgi:hypothetical protein